MRRNGPSNRCRRRTRSLIKAAPAVAAQPVAAAAGAPPGARTAIRAAARSPACAAARPASTSAPRSSVRSANRCRTPLCGFYAAAFTRLMALFNIGAHTEVVACRGTGEPSCVLKWRCRTGSSRAEARVRALAPSRCWSPARGRCARRRARSPAVARILVDAVRQREARRRASSGWRSVRRAAHRRSATPSAPTRSRGRSGSRRSSVCRCRRSPRSPTRR